MSWETFNFGSKILNFKIASQDELKGWWGCMGFLVHLTQCGYHPRVVNVPCIESSDLPLWSMDYFHILKDISVYIYVKNSTDFKSACFLLKTKAKIYLLSRQSLVSLKVTENWSWIIWVYYFRPLFCPWFVSTKTKIKRKKKKINLLFVMLVLNML